MPPLGGGGHMSLELSESGMGLDLCAKFGEFSPMGSMTSLEEEEFLGIQ